MRRSFLAACALGMSQVLTVLAAGAPECVNTCVNQVRGNFNQLKCTSANDAGCLCAAPGFFDGVKECSEKTCAGTEAQVQSFLNGEFCIATPIGASKSGSTSAAPAATSSSAAPVTSSSAAPVSTSSTQPSTSAASTTSMTATSTGTASATTTDSSSSQATSSTTDAAPASTSGSSATDGEKQDEGLSHAAVVGIAVGCTAAGVAILAVVACLLLRRRRAAQPKSGKPGPQISKPIVSPGRNTISPDPDAYEKYGNDDIEMRTHRYEDMPPQQVPRTMV